VSDGLYINRGQVSEAWDPFSITFLLGRRQVILGSFLLVVAFLAVFCAGVGFGLRKTIPFAV
jgi:hypothetical protein